MFLIILNTLLIFKLNARFCRSLCLAKPACRLGTSYLRTPTRGDRNFVGDVLKSDTSSLLPELQAERQRLAAIPGEQRHNSICSLSCELICPVFWFVELFCADQ